MSSNHPQSEVILASASGSAGGLGKIAAVAATSGTVMVRCPNSGFGRTDAIDWRVKSDQAFTYQLYRARSAAAYSVTLTLASFTDADTIILNGLTITGESTAADAAFASRKFYTGGGTDTLDAVELAKVINADNTITPNGSVSVGDTITVTTTCDEKECPGHTYVYTAAAAPAYATRVFDQSGNQAAELASIVLALNHKRNVTLASVTAGDTVTFNVGGRRLTYTAHSTTTTAANREFSISGTNSQDGDELVVCLNDATYGLGSGWTAVNASGVVSITRNGSRYEEPYITSSNSTRLACVNTEGGVPGVNAAATGATGELALTPTWVKTLAVTTSNGTRLATTDVDIPGVYATSADAVVTLTAGTPGSPVGGEMSYVLQATAANRCTVAEVLSSLALDGAVSSSQTANSTVSAGNIYNQTAKGWESCYLKFINGAGSNATITVAATKY